MVPIPLLAELREMVLRHNDGKRCPKWSFRLAADLVVQIQPRPCLLPLRPGQPQRVVEFQGLAHQEPDGVVPNNIFRPDGKDLLLGGAWCRLKFELFQNAGDDAWTFKAKHWRASRHAPNGLWNECRARVLERLPGRLSSLRPELMLTHHCLACGKALTDPASVARWIGPECYGSGALTVPGMDRDETAARLFAAAGV
jgi:hypothetical protein